MTSPTTSPAPIARQSLATVAQDILLENIISGELTPGIRLSLDELCDTLAISRTPIREALLVLARENFVEITPNAGTLIADWGVGDMRFRAHALGSIARFGAQQGMMPPPRAIRSDFDDLRAFVTACTAFTRTLDNTLARQTAGRLATPLQLFLQPSVLRARGIREKSEALAPALASLADALAYGDTERTTAALETLTTTFVDSLFVPTEDHNRK